MDAELKCLRDSGYDVSLEFIDEVRTVNLDKRLLIIEVLGDLLERVVVNDVMSTVLSGVVEAKEGPLAFVVEFTLTNGLVTLTAFSEVSMDEHLDMINLKLQI